MGSIISVLWKALASLVAALGAAVVARTYTETPTMAPRLPAAGGYRGAPGDGVEGKPAEHATSTALQPGWSRPKPEVIPRPTYWPFVFAIGIAFIFWGIISDIFIFGTGVIFFVVALVGWINDLLNE